MSPWMGSNISYDPIPLILPVFQYTILIVIIFMIQSVIGLLAYVYQDQVDNELQENLHDNFISTYGVHEENTLAVDRIQSKVG